MKVKQLIAVLALIGAGLFGSGCAALVVGAGAGAGGYAYMKGEMRAEESISVGKAVDASKKALETLGFRVTTSSADALKGKVEGSGAEGRMVTVVSERVESGNTRIGVRVGAFGDRDQAAVILDEIRKQAGIR